MANIKFSAFTNQAAADTTYLVGYDGTDNTNYTKAQIKTWLTTGSNAIPTLYSADGALISARTITMDGNTLSMAQASGNTVTFSSLNNEGISIAGGFNYKIATGSGAFTIDSSTSSNSNAIVLQTNNGAGTNASILIDSRSPGANADLHLKTATKLKIDLPVAATVGYVLKADDTAGNVIWSAQTDTTYTGGTDINISASDVINHDTIVSSATTDSSTLTFGGTFTAIDSVNVSTQGHVTAKNTKTYTLPSAQTLPTGADPSATISGTVANGSATTFMRSDAVPALGSTITIGTGGTTRGLVDIEGGSSLDAQLRLNCSAGTHAVVIEGPQHLNGSNYIIKLPHGAPALNKILKVGTYTANAGSYADPSLATMIWADDTDTSIYAANGNLTADRTVTMNNVAGNAPYNLTFAGITTSKVTFSNLGGVQFDEDVTFVKNTIIQGQAYTELNSLSNTLTVNWNDSNVQTISGLTGAHTFTPTNPKAGATYILTLIQTGAVTATWGSYIKWAAPDSAATPPTLSGAGKTDVITLICWSATANSGAGGYYGSITKDLS